MTVIILEICLTKNLVPTDEIQLNNKTFGAPIVLLIYIALITSNGKNKIRTNNIYVEEFDIPAIIMITNWLKPKRLLTFCDNLSRLSAKHFNTNISDRMLQRLEIRSIKWTCVQVIKNHSHVFRSYSMRHNFT